MHKGGEEPGEADGKSVMQMIILAASEGTPLRIEADGDDAEEAVDEAGRAVREQVRRRRVKEWRVVSGQWSVKAGIDRSTTDH